MPDVEIRSMEEFLAFTASEPAEGRVYRGQAHQEWGLVPSFYRGVDPASLHVSCYELDIVERDLYREYDLKATQFIGRPSSIWEVLVSAQHHGTPTRLLDWTARPLAAAYFACSAAPAHDGAIWYANPANLPLAQSLGRVHMGRGLRVQQIRRQVPDDDLPFMMPVSKPVSVATQAAAAGSPQPAGSSFEQADASDHTGFLTFLDPPFTNRRIEAQSGLFSVYIPVEPADIVLDHASYLAAVEAKWKRLLLNRVVIPANAKAGLLRSLDRLGVNSFSLFPDLEGLSTYLRGRHRDIIDDLPS